MQQVLQAQPANASVDLQSFGVWFVLFVIGIVFGFVINTLFGHPTYHAIQHQPLLRTTTHAKADEEDNVCTGMNNTDVGKQSKACCAQAFHNATDLPEGVAFHTISFLNAHERLQLAQTAKTGQRLADHSELWDQLIQLCAHRASQDLDKQAQQQIHQLCADTPSTKRGFFEAVHRLAPIITASHRRANEEEAYVIVHRRVYHLTSYMNDHPGGALIIRSYNGKDATKMYDRALHSQVAKLQARKFVVWDPARFIGASSGVPTFAKAAVVSGADGWLEPRSHGLQP